MAPAERYRREKYMNKNDQFVEGLTKLLVEEARKAAREEVNFRARELDETKERLRTLYLELKHNAAVETSLRQTEVALTRADSHTFFGAAEYVGIASTSIDPNYTKSYGSMRPDLRLGPYNMTMDSLKPLPSGGHYTCLLLMFKTG